MTSLKDLLVSYKECAAQLGDYKLLTVRELAEGYCKADEENDEKKLNRYYSALFLHYAGVIPKWQVSCASLNVDVKDLVTWLHEAIQDALYYRSWMRKRHDHKAEKACGYKEKIWIDNPQYVEDENAADKSIHYFISAKRGKEYQAANKDKRKTNTQTYSVEGQVDDNGDCALDYMGCIKEPIEPDGTKDLIRYFLSKNKRIEALVLDGIINGDSFKDKKVITYKETQDSQGRDINKKFINHDGVFDKRKLVKHLTSINQDYMQKIFCPCYSLPFEEGLELFDKLKQISNGRLYKYIEKTLIEIKSNKRLLSYLI